MRSRFPGLPVRQPSPALVISVIALAVAVGGGTFAVAAFDNGHDKKIAKRVVNHRAPQLTVKNAKNLGGKPPSAFLPADTVQSTGAKILTLGQTGVPLVKSGSLSYAASCTKTAGVTKVEIDVTSTEDNWLDFGSVKAASTQMADSTNDSSSPGSVRTGNDRIQAQAPSGASILGQDAFAVNWPAVGNCMVTLSAVAGHS